MSEAARLRLELTGAVQGVGFRPFVYRLAREAGLAGFVRNTGDGVCIEVEGAARSVDQFLDRLDAETPPHAVIDMRRSAMLTPQGARGFSVLASTAPCVGAAVVMADFATCPDCLGEIWDPANRRHRYPFTTCTQCGPRYSVIEALPYDRARTTMRDFPLCGACRAEYHDPTSRRFHAESIACPQCGPRVALWDAGGTVTATRDAALRDAATALRDGRILALKGLGGFQLMADAGNAAAIERLRHHKQRPRKPFAVMVPSLAAAEALAPIDVVERDLLRSAEAPIVLVRQHAAAGLDPNVAISTPCLGLMLPSTPLHHLLLHAVGGPVIATSGNRGDEPIVTDEAEALHILAGIADLFLIHDRPILHAVDDSVVRVMAGQPVVLRRARGYAPLPIRHAPIERPILALGGHQKAAVAVGGRGQLFLGPHIGDLTTAATRDAFARAADTLPRLHGITPTIVGCDRHPDYHTTHNAAERGLPVISIPHHLAHVLAAMVDNGLEGPVLGVAWDGTGYGDDGTIWGGEFLTVGSGRYRRVGHLLPFRLPGGEAAVREPRRAALGMVHALDTTGRPDAAFTPAERTVLCRMLARGVNAPWTSSAGRLFDAVASLLNLCQVSSFEGEAALMVEAAADRATTLAPLPGCILDAQGRLDWRPMIAALAASDAPPEPLAAALHDRLAEAIVAMACRNGLPQVVLTGGCFQNARLTERCVALLRAAGFSPFWHRIIPPNDGGLAAGQIAFAARPLIEEPA